MRQAIEQGAASFSLRELPYGTTSSLGVSPRGLPTSRDFIPPAAPWLIHYPNSNKEPQAFACDSLELNQS